MADRTGRRRWFSGWSLLIVAWVVRAAGHYTPLPVPLALQGLCLLVMLSFYLWVVGRAVWHATRWVYVRTWCHRRLYATVVYWVHTTERARKSGDNPPQPVEGLPQARG